MALSIWQIILVISVVLLIVATIVSRRGKAHGASRARRAPGGADEYAESIQSEGGNAQSVGFWDWVQRLSGLAGLIALVIEVSSRF